jgi:uncharacterized protein YutE (UPF0331/DUF86 family)
MVRAEVLKERLKQLSASLEKIERFKHLSLEEYLKDDIAQDVVEYNLFISINMIINIATHIVVDNNIGKPVTLADSFKLLNKNKYITNEELDIYKNMLGFRNILSHEYIKINKKIVYEIMQNYLIDLKKFIIMVNDKF